MTARIQLLHDTATNWTSADSVLRAGELGIEEDTGQFKIGDGSTAWTSLPYAGGGGAMALDDLTDVNAPSPTDQWVLTWDSTPGEWIAAPAAGGAPTGSAGGDLSGTYPNPSVVDDSHSHSHDSTITGVSANDHHTEDHDHDGSPTQKLLQANTHETPDTDSGTSSLHHTIGTSATQAAAGNHTHAGGSVATDTIWDAAGDLAVGTGADTASKLSISVPAANVLNVLGVVNGETTWSVKAVHDSTNPAALGAAAPGTALTAAHRDHVHPTTGLVTSGTKISALTADTSPTTDDLIVTVNDPGGTPATRKVTIANLITLEGSASNPAALGTAAAGTSGNKLSRDDHVHPTTGLVTTTVEVVGGGGDIAINDTNYVTLATTTFDIAAGNIIIAELEGLILNNSGATKTYTVVFDVNGFLVEGVEQTTHGANASNRASHTIRATAEIRATNLAYANISDEWAAPTSANNTVAPSLSQLARTWNTTTGNATGSGVTVRIRIKSSANNATQTFTVLGWRMRKI